MTTHSSILSWRIPWTKPRGLQSIRSQRVGHDRFNIDAHTLPDSCALIFKPCCHCLIPPLLSGRIFFLSRHPSFLNTFLHLDQPCPHLRSRATRGWSLPEPVQVSCDTLQGAECGPTGNFPACEELVTPVWRKAHIGFQHLPEYCRTAPPAHFTYLGMVAPHSPRRITHTHTLNVDSFNNSESRKIFIPDLLK